MNLKSLSDEILESRLKDLSQRDLAIAAELIAHIHEFMIRKLYLIKGRTSIFSYLTEDLGYPRATAQNRIDAASLLQDLPEVKSDLAHGKINLSQITIMASGLRQMAKENSGQKASIAQKRELFEKVKQTKGEHEAKRLVAQELAITAKPTERTRVHADGSVTLEITLSKEQYENLKRVRDLQSHKNHNATLGETIGHAVQFYREKKDPTLLKTKLVAPVLKAKPLLPPVLSLKTSSNSNHGTENLNQGARKPISSRRSLTASLPQAPKVAQTPRKYISQHVIRAIHKRDQTCQWVNPQTGERCGSSYQTQVDHIQGLADGGGNEIQNLALLCGVHNRLKFEMQRCR